MVVFHSLIQGSLALPQRISQQSLAVVQSSRSLTPELVGAFRSCHLQPHQECKPPGDIDLQAFSRGRIVCAKGADLVNEFCPGSRVGGRGLSLAEYAGISRMRGNSFASLPSCSYPSSMTPSIPYRAIAINGHTLDHTSWKSLVSGLPRPFRHNPALPWYWLPSAALRGLKTNHYGSVAGKKSGQDLLVRDSDKCVQRKSDCKDTRSEKDSITALYGSESNSGDEKEKKKEKIYGEAVIGCEEDSDSESEDDEEDRKKEQKKERKMRAMQEQEEDSESDSDDDKEQKMKKSMSRGKVEVVGMCEEDSDSDSDSDEEKKMRKKMEADEREMKKQAKKEKMEMKAMKKMEECEDSDSEDEDKKKNKKKKKEKKKMLADKDAEDLEKSESAANYDGHEGEDDDVVEVVSDALNVDEVEDDDFELVGDEDLVDEIENEIEDDFEEFEDEELDDDFWEEEEGEAKVGDGGDGGGVVLGETKWGNEALELAKEVVEEMGTDFSIFAFKVSPDGLIRVRLDKLSDQYGSPTMADIEKFSRRYSEVLDNSELIPESVAVEVSSPGAERVVNIPDDLERFKLLPMYVQYLEDESGNEEKDGILELDSVDPESGMTVWKLANVKFNREQSGKGRPFNSKQRKWRAHVPMNSLKLVRLYLDM